ncbi:hypothetical protein BJ138DRAFT_1143686 [Hygrophoropsis aurantiaca]|uniref:Uncharacterized protein n=1 Tax=Hygrophoropsis aurantiaca TaxID=72124 RepID=A0ACB8ANN9_9AGAM|nr:hypothetical protein BJ138DRAFT_1143686 [Hygrophoropsis aurantiaca]
MLKDVEAVYIPLLSESQAERDEEIPNSSLTTTHNVPIHRSLDFIPCVFTGLGIIALVLTAVNLAILHYRVGNLVTHGNPSLQRVPSVYIGLESIGRNRSSPSWPLASGNDPDFVGLINHDAMHRQLRPLPRNRGQMVLNSENDAALQYRVRDFGMESCAVDLRLPDQKGKEYAIRGKDVRVGIWSVNAAVHSVLTASNQTWPSGPGRREYIGSLPVIPGRSRSPFFRCPTRSLQTLELSLECDSCSIKFTQDRHHPTSGFGVIQTEVQIT